MMSWIHLQFCLLLSCACDWHSDVITCHHQLSLTICSSPLSVLSSYCSICSAVFYLVPSSILDSNTGFGQTCLFGYCVRLKVVILHVMQNVIYYIPPFSTAYDLCQQISRIFITINVCRKGFTHCYWLTYCVITFIIILLLKYGVGLCGITNYRYYLHRCG